MTRKIEPDPRVRREVVAANIAARTHAKIIADQMKERIERFIRMEILSTEKDDHTVSLSERVTHLERELGIMRNRLDWLWGQHDQMKRQVEMPNWLQRTFRTPYFHSWRKGQL